MENTLLRSVAGVFGLTSQVIIIMSLLLAVSRSPWFKWTEHDLSFLGVEGSAIKIFNYGLILGGAFSLVFAIGLWQNISSGRVFWQVGGISLILGSVALSAIGIFPRSVITPHNLASVSFFTFVSVAIFFTGISVIRTWPGLWGALSIGAAVLIVIFQRATWPWGGGAIPQVLSSLPWSLWTMAVALRLLVNPVPG